MTLWRLIWRHFFPKRVYDLTGTNAANIYAAMTRKR